MSCSIHTSDDTWPWTYWRWNVAVIRCVCIHRPTQGHVLVLECWCNSLSCSIHRPTHGQVLVLECCSNSLCRCTSADTWTRSGVGMLMFVFVTAGIITCLVIIHYCYTIFNARCWCHRPLWNALVFTFLEAVQKMAPCRVDASFSFIGFSACKVFTCAITARNIYFRKIKYANIFFNMWICKKICSTVLREKRPKHNNP